MLSRPISKQFSASFDRRFTETTLCLFLILQFASLNIAQVKPAWAAFEFPRGFETAPEQIGESYEAAQNDFLLVRAYGLGHAIPKSLIEGAFHFLADIAFTNDFQVGSLINGNLAWHRWSAEIHSRFGILDDSGSLTVIPERIDGLRGLQPVVIRPRFGIQKSETPLNIRFHDEWVQMGSFGIHCSICLPTCSLCLELSRFGVFKSRVSGTPYAFIRAVEHKTLEDR